MTSHVDALCFDANDPLRLGRFWAGVLGWEMADDPPGGIALLPSDDTGFRIRFLPTREQKTGPNQMHFDLTSASLALVLLALPVIAGVLTARAVSRRPGSARALKILALVVLLGMAVLYIISVIMIHGPF